LHGGLGAEGLGKAGGDLRHGEYGALSDGNRPETQERLEAFATMNCAMKRMQRRARGG